MDTKKYISEEEFSLARAIRSLQDWIKYLFDLRYKIIIGAIIFSGCFFAFQHFRKTNYTAKTTFVLESESKGGLGSFSSSLANIAGISLGSLTDENSIFQIDNIIELYNSYNIMKKTLLSEDLTHNNGVRLITQYGIDNKLIKRWNERGISFEIPEENMKVEHDSVLKVVVKRIKENELDVSKPNRKLSILQVSFISKNEAFAKSFNETIVSYVNDFYLTTKTSKSSENLRVLSHQADSVKNVLDKSLLKMAQFNDANISINPRRTELIVERQEISIDAQVSAAVYEEIVKNLEIAKLTHRNKSPLIQVIDSPVFPLEDDKMKWYKSLILGLLVGGLLLIGFFSLKRSYKLIMDQ